MPPEPEDSLGVGEGEGVVAAAGSVAGTASSDFVARSLGGEPDGCPGMTGMLLERVEANDDGALGLGEEYPGNA